ncbi:MAG TPA: HD domain-containing protein [Steroidobacteraceae bacterium]
MQMSMADEVFAIFARRGAGAYFGERVSMTEHALQAAHFAQLQSAPAWLVLAALLHDIGHLVVEVPADIGDWKTDGHHEEIGSRWLERRFSPEIARTVRLHVPAKRYLCATDPDYSARLSPASVITLKLQGGPMSAAGVTQFETEPFYREAVRLRHWDDQGKVAGLRTPSLQQHRDLIEALASAA